MMYVMTPYSNRKYITPNTLYEYTPHERFANSGYIRDDKGHQIFICLKNCAHLDGRTWTLIEKPKQPENKGLWNVLKKFLKK